VAAIPEVRAALLEFQRSFARRRDGAILDGRDIGTVICPDAEVKLYVTASDEVRSERRFKELTSKGMDVTLKSVSDDLKESTGCARCRAGGSSHEARDRCALA